ncbi:protein translocase subunit [Plesiocystis pacifica SIR-1]|uniref:Protein translocase subunit SecD n=1 Tax=Plesiocystis pacifica SIR-1 TaxID=391625 RepID=A6G9V8_9BACT|nr:protein translocase subunit SecD [Plesiocystis pacifica]EDM77394.1 protein translocase subunit [Plesiocystis pacifica SIR-1]
MRRFVKLKALLLVLLLAVAAISVAPSVARIADITLPSWITQTFTREFKLGLDLQGGLHLEYSVAVDEALRNKLDQMAGELESAFKEKKDVKVTVDRTGIDTLDIKFDNPEDVKLATEDVMAVAIGYLVEDPDAEGMRAEGIIRMKVPEEVIAENRKAVVGQALDTVRRRVDAMGVAEPNIYPKNRHVVVELPGVSDTATELRAAAKEAGDQLSSALRESADVQIKVVENREDPGALDVRIPERDARKILGEAIKIVEEDGVQLLVTDQLGVQMALLPVDLGAEPDPEMMTITMTEAGRDKVLEGSSGFRRLLKVIERAATLQMHLVDDETPFKDTGVPYLRALYEAGFVHQGMGISVNQEADYGRPEKGGVVVEEPYTFIALERETLETFFRELPAEWRLPKTHKVAYGQLPIPLRRGEEPTQFWRTYIVRSRADITGDRIINATVGFKQDTGVPQVEVSFDKIGARDFDRMSGDNVGRKMAIIMDDMVMSDPVFNERISGGNVVITLGSTPGESIREAANDLVKVLKSGSLPARLNKEFEIRVGADLGQESVEKGFKAFVIGLGLVIVFMGIYYRGAGLIAVFALVMNMVLVLAAMALFQATLTLPGIAGIVLTIGMAVDANVIIFERVREFLREGYTARKAIEAGYDRAFTTILDSQLTTAIAGIVLWQFGSGPIRGFAITLLIGIATSIFTGVFATRVFFDWQANRRGFDKVSI